MRKAAYILYMATLMIGPVLFGGRRYYADMLVTLGALAGSVLLIAADAVEKRHGGRKLRWPKTRFNYLWLGVTALLLFQLLPLPEGVVRFISPAAWEAGQQSVPAAEAVLRPGAVPEFLSLSVYRHPAQMTLVRFTAYALFFLGMLRLLDTRKRLERTVLAIVILCLAEVVYGLVATYGSGVYILWEKWPQVRYSMSGTFVNRNHFAGLLEIGLMLAAGYGAALVRRRTDPFEKKPTLKQRLTDFAKDSEHRSKRLFVVFSGAVMVLGLALSSSRGGIISATAGLLALSVLFLFRPGHRWKGKLLLVIFAVGAVYSLQAGIVRTVKRFERSPESLEVRMRLAGRTLDIFSDHPAVGAGAGSFRYVYPRYQAAVDGKKFYDHAHSDWAEFLAEYGVAGFLVTFGAAAWFLAGYFRTWARRRDPLAVCLGAALPAMLVSYAVHSLGEFNLHIPANFLMLMAAAAVCTAALLHEKHGRRTRYRLSLRRAQLKGRGGAALLAVLALAGWAGIQAASHFRAEAALSKVGLAVSHYAAGLKGAGGISPGRALSAARAAEAINPENARYPFVEATARMRGRQEGWNGGAAGTGPLSGGEGADPTIVAALERSIAKNPYPAEAHLHLGWEYARFFDRPGYMEKWLPAADLSMYRAALFTGEKTPRHHVDLGHYWTMRSATEGLPNWALAVSHYRKAQALEPNARVRKRMQAEIRSFVSAFYPGQIDRRMAEVLP